MWRLAPGLVVERLGVINGGRRSEPVMCALGEMLAEQAEGAAHEP